MDMTYHAQKIWDEMLVEPNLFGDHRRNTDAVNFCIVANILGKDIAEAYKDMCDYHLEHETDEDLKLRNPNNYIQESRTYYAEYDFQLGIDHINRVNDYVDSWEERDELTQGLAFAIMDADYMAV